jgi:hypothetical protein
MKKRRAIEEIGLSFLDVICCGFGAIILLLMITKIVAPSVLEATTIDLEGQVASKRDAIFEIRGQLETLTRQLTEKERDFDNELLQLAKLQQQTSDILSKFEATQEVADQQLTEEAEMARAKQSLTDEMERLLGMNFKRSSQTIGGITVDSEHIIFVIDNSGSMYNYAWTAVIRKLQETLNIYPNVKGIQVLNDNGAYLFPRYARTWMSDSPALRKSIINKLRNWDAFSNSSPVEGIEEAITTFYDPGKRISIYVFGDDFQGTSIERVVDTIDQINVADAEGTRRVRIHAVGFPVLFQGRRHPPSVYRFSALMRELTYRNNGTFVGLPYIQ